MDDLIRNLQNYELNRQQGQAVKEEKKEKSVALNMSMNDGSEEKDEMAYLTRRHWRIRMRDYLAAEDIEVWDMICEGPYVPTMEVKVGEITRVIPKTIKQYND
ncbi:hypothetical protein MTR67_001442 [Solanum verrucosum]|uniref:Uncharacterized protein n=1 Tax=Solanum verrucosum TaxID=315347 RepID=A0AAF0PP99_SOLVR|nr:hypothetical protein MTR67_001442 [Solanum verrucosum]